MTRVEKSEFDQVTSDLKRLGTAQNVKIYKRHGAGENLYGVSFAELRKLAKKLKINHALAMQLWNTGNFDARNLALMIVDFDKFSKQEAEKMVSDSNVYVLVDSVADLISKTAFGFDLMDEWMKSSEEHRKQCGYSILSSSLKNEFSISDAKCKKILKDIEVKPMMQKVDQYVKIVNQC